MRCFSTTLLPLGAIDCDMFYDTLHGGRIAVRCLLDTAACWRSTGL